jgi:pimeloyl-ACP methyl ester carboxylesterase
VVVLKRRWKVLIGLLAVLAVLLAVNTVTTQSQTKEAETTVEDGQILELSSGAVQVTDSGEADGQPIVLLHGYANSLHWFDAIEPLLAEDHRVIRIDLLGFGGSEKPESGYSIPEQASTVAEALNQLDVQGALVVGNSMGGPVTASLAEQASQLVDRAVLIPGEARLHARPGRGDVAHYARFRDQGRLQEGVRPWIRPRHSIRGP